MAFKMKGFPYSGKSPIKGRIRGWDEETQKHNTAHDLHDAGKGPDPHEGETGPNAETKPFQQKEKTVKVRYEDLDEMGKKIFDCNKNPKTMWNNKTKKCEPTKDLKILQKFLTKEQLDKYGLKKDD